MKLLAISLTVSDTWFLFEFNYMNKHFTSIVLIQVWYSIIEEHIWWTSKELTGGMLNRLKEIQLGNFGSSNHEIEFIEFLVKNGRIAQDHDGSSLHQK